MSCQEQSKPAQLEPEGCSSRSQPMGRIRPCRERRDGERREAAHPLERLMVEFISHACLEHDATDNQSTCDHAMHNNVVLLKRCRVKVTHQTVHVYAPQSQSGTPSEPGSPIRLPRRGTVLGSVPRPPLAGGRTSWQQRCAGPWSGD